MQRYADFIPSEGWIANLKPGDLAPDCFGTMSVVRDIRYAGTDINGRRYVGVTLHFGPQSSISQSYKVGESVHTVQGGTSGRLARTA